MKNTVDTVTGLDRQGESNCLKGDVNVL
jgi:hypothetical protein